MCRQMKVNLIFSYTEFQEKVLEHLEERGGQKKEEKEIS